MSNAAPNPSDAKILSTAPLVRLLHSHCTMSSHKPSDGVILNRRTKTLAGPNSCCAQALHHYSCFSPLLIYCNSTTYNDPLGKKRTWEHAERSVFPFPFPSPSIIFFQFLCRERTDLAITFQFTRLAQLNPSSMAWGSSQF